MTEKLQVYKCGTCGNIAELLHGGKGDLVCCGEPMAVQVENTVDASKEKHVPVVEKTDAGVRVKVGSVPHPMVPEHYIEWVQVNAGGKSYRRFLNPGESPEAEFSIEAEGITAREYCNLHGLWKS
ncbi:MAG: desulfoferrodoxin [bacterium]